ncbi:MAG: ester cyclase [Ktedonobacteraceae bacterium]|nr:ester cyclase [Ktedonobacteraceae bacterium]
MSTEAENMDLVRRLIGESEKKRAVDNADQFFAAGFTLHDNAHPAYKTGYERGKDFVSSHYSAFPDLAVQIDDIFASGDKVAFRWSSQGTQKGVLRGVPPSNKSANMYGIAIMRFEDGKLAEMWSVQDTYGMLDQLGHLAKVGTVGVQV